MKLHLPTALFALAVLPAVAFAEMTYTIHDAKDYPVNPEKPVVEVNASDYKTDDGFSYEVPVIANSYGLISQADQIIWMNVDNENKTLELGEGDKITCSPTTSYGAKALYIDGNLKISGGASVYVGGSIGAYQKGGIVAKEVTVDGVREYTGDEGAFDLKLGAALFDKLTVNSGSVSLRNDGVDNGGSIYGAGTDYGHSQNASSHNQRYEFSNVSVNDGLVVNGGHVRIGRSPNSGNEEYICRYDDLYFQSTIGGFIYQKDGYLDLHGMTYLHTDTITQDGGEMTIATNSSTTMGVYAEYLRIGKDKVTVAQNGGTLNLQGIIVKGASGDEALQLNVSQTGSGTINMITGERIDEKHNGQFDKYGRPIMVGDPKGEYIGSYFTSELGKESLISQSGSGQVNIGSDYQSATFNVEQKGEGSVTLKEHGVLRSSVVSINDKSTFTVAAGGTLLLNKGAQLNLTVGTGSVGLQVENGGSITSAITSASADSTVVVNILLTEDAMKSKISMADLADLLDGTADSLTFNVNIAQFGDADAAAKFAGMLTMTGNEQVLTYTPDVATFSGEGAVPTDLAITVTGFTNAEGMVQAQVSAKRYTAPVPEPATATLSLLALAGLCARRRRK